MKTFRNKIDNFFKWVKGTELVELTNIDVSEDPVRPELDLDWRLSAERKIYGLSYENDIEAIVCVAYTNEVPTTVKELEYMSQVACQDNQSGSIAVAYTVWSRKRGAGREIITKLLEFVKEKPYIKRLITLSPLTPMATHFHMKNGAKLISINTTTQNFEYEWLVH
jgi:hypothetical protein|tara:strand:+ start:956 stop:1453 length:498 start_codon:yes stop_codon:yes gene_type:complete